MKFIKRGDKSAVKDIDKKVKNKWSWKWMEEVISLDVPKVGPVSYKIEECFEKVDECGVAYCTWCKDKVLYGGNEKKKHTQTDIYQPKKSLKI